MENETDEVVSGVSTLSMAVERSGPLSFADICDLGAEVAGSLADQHDGGDTHGHVAVGSVVRLDDGPWRLAPAELVPDIEPVVAPELAAGVDPTPAGDIYALGAVLSFGLTGIVVDPLELADTAAPDGAAEPGDDPIPGGDEVEDAPGRIGVDSDGEPTLSFSTADLDRLRAFGDAPADADPVTDEGRDPAAPTATPADGDGAVLVEPVDEADEDGESAGGDDAPLTLPDVMSSFLVVLRTCLAADPADRPSASSLAATLRQLRSDAESVLGGALVGGATAVAIGDAAGAEPWGEPLYDTSDVEPGYGGSSAGALSVEGTGSAATLAAAGAKSTSKKSFKERAPVFVAAAAVFLALILGVSLVRERGNTDADLLAVGPTVGTTVRRTTTTTIPALPVDLIVETTTTLASSTTSSTSTTKPPEQEVVVDTTVVTTTTTTAPTTTLPDTTTTAPTTSTTRVAPGLPVTVVCGSGTVPCPAKLYSEPATAPPSVVKGEAPNGTVLSAQCAKDGEMVGTSKVWVRIIGQGEFFWIPKAAVSSTTLPPCPA